MTQSLRELEDDIEQTRARLDRTIDRIQDRLSVTGIVDEVMGSVRTTQFNRLFDGALDVVRRNPVPVILVAAGVGWLIHRLSRQAELRPSASFDPYRASASDVPVLNTGNARIYDPDVSPRHPGRDSLDGRRETNARA